MAETLESGRVKVHLVDGTYELFRSYFGAPPPPAPTAGRSGATRGLMRSLLGAADRARRHPRGLRVRPRHRVVPQRPLRRLQDQRGRAPRAARAVRAGRARDPRPRHRRLADGGVRGGRRPRHRRRPLGPTRRTSSRSSSARRTRTSPSACAARAWSARPAAPASSSTRRRCKAKFGVRPESIPDWLALVGDTRGRLSGPPALGRQDGGRAARALRAPGGHPVTSSEAGT